MAVLGGFILLQLFLAVISDTFTALEDERKEREAEEEEVRLEKEAKRAARNSHDEVPGDNGKASLLGEGTDKEEEVDASGGCCGLCPQGGCWSRFTGEISVMVHQQW